MFIFKLVVSAVRAEENDFTELRRQLFGEIGAFLKHAVRCGVAETVGQPFRIWKGMDVFSKPFLQTVISRLHSDEICAIEYAHFFKFSPAARQSLYDAFAETYPSESIEPARNRCRTACEGRGPVWPDRRRYR